ncbi:hypothetical protein HY405_01860 [Candidatus Microgenomates bacterium]|nr:hypothetical protein [Candidatus Microgenomates bacterium]
MRREITQGIETAVEGTLRRFNPMIPESIEAMPRNLSAYFLEIGMEGRRVMVYLSGRSKPEVIDTEDGSDLLPAFPELNNPLSYVSHQNSGLVLDGIVHFKGGTLREAGMVQTRIAMRDDPPRQGSELDIVRCGIVFSDILYKNGTKVTSKPLFERRALLATVLPEDLQKRLEEIGILPYWDDPRYFETVRHVAKEQGYGRLYLKRRTSKYTQGPSANWKELQI